MKLSQNAKGIISIIGACFLYLSVGSTYILGNINIYVCSYYAGITSDETSIIFPTTTIVGNIVVLLSLPIRQIIGYRAMLILATFLTFAFIFASTFCENFWIFFVCFGIGYGGSTGFLYLNLLYNAYKYFPTRRGLIGGILMGVYGVSSLISNYILLYSMNPDNTKALKNPDTNEYYFPNDIASRLPTALRNLSYYFLGVMIIGNFLQFEFKDEIVKNHKECNEIVVKEKEICDIKIILLQKSNNSINDKLNSCQDPKEMCNEPGCKTLKQAFKSKAFYLMIIMSYFSIQNGYFMASNFKNYGISKISDDSFLTLVGSLGCVFNGGGRFFWGVLSDKLDFKKVYLIILTIQIIDIATLRFVSEYKIAYLIWVCIALLCEGGHFVLFPPLSLKVFGVKVGSTAFSFVLWGIACANLTQFGMNLGLRPYIGFENEFYIYCGFTIISFLVCITNIIKFKP